MPSPDAAAGDIESALDDFARADADCIAAALACGRTSFSYRRLPEPRRLRLTVRKLDDSYFDVQIARSAAVWELKAAIEDVFAALYDETDNKAISWQHVWSHFCLCFKDEKLTDDKATLRAFGIRDGDELHFAQHLSVEYRPCKSLSLRRSRTSLDDFSARSRSLLDDLGEDDGDKFIDTRHSTSVLEEGLYVYQHDEECMEQSRKKGGFFSAVAVAAAGKDDIDAAASGKDDIDAAAAGKDDIDAAASGKDDIDAATAGNDEFAVAAAGKDDLDTDAAAREGQHRRRRRRERRVRYRRRLLQRRRRWEGRVRCRRRDLLQHMPKSAARRHLIASTHAGATLFRSYPCRNKRQMCTGTERY
ncbi:hypothetical protein OsI_06171 [Oryza sativa Indica Group]|uniref:SNRNP25 ubiquitin-like domain-containing protein n=1 Tax=Oryza sativa subsp. indica TaxID=39946 RepID=B8AJ87_ORYSI|nr:hypothetical protein OsI_06171 [Oryza sativa Indica Group]